MEQGCINEMNRQNKQLAMSTMEGFPFQEINDKAKMNASVDFDKQLARDSFYGP